MKTLDDKYSHYIVGVVERCGCEPFVVYDEAKLLEHLQEV